MGMVIFEESGTFNPADWGLQVGDMLQVICVGGGAGGAGAASRASDAFTGVLGEAGGTSSFGSYLSAEGASANPSTPNGMGKGGGVDSYPDADDRYSYRIPGGGAGGFLPGAPIFGGDGGNGVYYNFDATAGVPVNSHAPSGLGGKGSKRVASSYLYESFVDLPFANLKDAAKGNKGSTATSQSGTAAAGNGYGAGGAGAAAGAAQSSGAYEPTGGNSGELKIGTVKLTSTAGIAVTVGLGGAGATATKSVLTVTAGNGAPGCVVVTW